MKKKILSLTIVLSIALSTVFSSSVFAANGGKVSIGPSGDSMTDAPITIEEQEKAILNQI